MKTIEKIMENPRLTILAKGTDGGWAQAYLFNEKKHNPEPATIIYSWGAGWDHVSVSYRRRCPTWEEMAAIKQMFFEPEEVCVEYHPKASEYVNQHPFCLHLFRCQNQEIPQPPSWMIGTKKGKRIDEIALAGNERLGT